MADEDASTLLTDADTPLIIRAFPIRLIFTQVGVSLSKGGLASGCSTIKWQFEALDLCRVREGSW